MSLRQILTLSHSPQVWPLSFDTKFDELPGFVVSVLAFLALLFLDRMLRERSEHSDQIERANLKLQTEVDERKQTEDALSETTSLFKVTIDQMPAAVSLKDPEGRYIVVNQTFQDWFNPDGRDLSVTTVRDLVNEDHSAEILAMEQRVRDSQKPRTQEMSIPVAGVGWRKALVHKFPLFAPDGSLSAIGTIETDYTELREAEAQLAQSQKMEAVGQLTGGLAHDFNNLLAIIRGHAELLAKDNTTNRHLEAIVRASDRGASLTHHLLAFSRKQVLEPQALDLNKSIDEFTGLLRGSLGEQIAIEVLPGADLWLSEADPVQLENVLLNLALNARDAMPKGGHLTIRTANTRLDKAPVVAQDDAVPGPYVMLSVTDDGAGMAPAVIEHAFEPFFTTKPVGTGTGLGLSMVYGFAKQSGGYLAVDSAEGEGTTIRLYLPKSDENEAVRPQPGPGRLPPAKGESVILVEDDPDVRGMAFEVLVDLGYRVREAATGAAALEIMAAAPAADLLLTDVILPGGMSGPELAAEAVRASPGIKLLYMSGYSGDAITHHGRLDPAAELLRKPFRSLDLAVALRKALDG